MPFPDLPAKSIYFFGPKLNLREITKVHGLKDYSEYLRKAVSRKSWTSSTIPTGVWCSKL